jgi:predicted ATPase
VALKGLTEALLEEGCCLVATSNRAPWELARHARTTSLPLCLLHCANFQPWCLCFCLLASCIRLQKAAVPHALNCLLACSYRHGLHEDMFNHFLASLQSACDVFSLDAQQDYRRLAAASVPLHPLTQSAACGEAADVGDGSDAGSSPATDASASYFFPLGQAADAALERQWRLLSQHAQRQQVRPDQADEHRALELPVLFGRRLAVPRTAGGAARFSFLDLCGGPLGAADYMALAQAFHTLFLEGVPQLSMQVGGGGWVDTGFPL